MKQLRRFFLALALAAACAGSAQAADLVASMDEASSIPSTTPTVVGLGVAVLPDYIGSDDYMGAPLFFARYTFAGSRRYIKLSGLSLEGNLLNFESVAFGPVVKYRMKRDDSVKDEQVKDMEELKGGLEAGAFVRYDHRGVANRRNRESVDLRFVADASGEYDGYQFDLDATLWRQVADKAESGQGEGGKLGLSVRPVTREEAAERGLSGQHGLLVAGVDPEGPAASAGLQAGDVITEVNGKAVSDATSLRSSVQAAGTRPSLVLVTRGKDSLYLTLRGRG